MFKRALMIAMMSAAITSPAVQAQEGTCAHQQMRLWIDAEEECYHRFGPMNERYNLADLNNEATLGECVDAAKATYVEARVICDLRGESAYREDGIHEAWARYRATWKREIKRIQSGG